MVRGTKVISLGGSVISSGIFPNTVFLKSFVALASSLKEQLVVVTGGGAVAKSYIHALRPIAKNEYYLDKVGIEATRLNAYSLMLVAKAQGLNAEIASSIGELEDLLKFCKIVILPGQFPGITTDADAVLACEALGCNVLVNVSSVGYVYDKPPGSSGARKLKRISHRKLVELASKYDTREAKSGFVFDLLACRLAQRSNIELRFVNSEISSIKQALNGRRFEGTLVKD
ncbi:MAG: hypothetical protein ACP5IK_00605 [Candidatus Micrarchaeia archaeon]